MEKITYILKLKDKVNKMEVIKELTKENLEIVKKEIENDNLVIFPTETVYGIGANALSENAVSKIFDVKERARNNPLIVHLKSKEEITKYAVVTNSIEQKLIDSFMPGPFTLILKKKDIIPECVTAGLDSVGIRIPINEIAHNFLEYVDLPIAAPSANISSRPSGTKVSDIKDEFDNLVNFIIDGGESKIGLESTVVKVIDNTPVILRPGFITKEDIESVVGNCLVSENVLKQISDKSIVESPGMLYKHYAPKTNCLLVYSKDLNNLKELINNNKTDKTIILGSSKLSNIPCYKFINYGDSQESISHNIFSLLRECDNYQADLIIIEGVEKVGLGLAIMNRLIRTSNFNYKEL